MAKKKRVIQPSAPPAYQSQFQVEIDQTMAAAVRLHQQGHLQQAEALYRSIISVDPGHADACHLLGVIAQQTGQHEKALRFIDQAISIKPNIAQYHFNRAVVLQSLARIDEAVKTYQRVVSLQPDYREAWENLGVALQDLEDLDAAATAYTNALQFEENSVLANQNIGTLLMQRGNTSEAESHFAKVLSVSPSSAHAHMKIAQAQLAQGKFPSGWQHWEWRYFSEIFLENNHVRLVPFPRWDGSSLKEKTILVTPEQGIGDEVMFASCFSDIISEADRVFIECDRRLQNLFQRSFPSVSFIPTSDSHPFYQSQNLPAVDWRIEAGSLPRFFRTDTLHFPGRPFLFADETLKSKWQDRLSRLSEGINIGISWRGGSNSRAHAARSIPLTMWQEIFATPDANVISLQYGDHNDEIEAFHRAFSGRLICFQEIDPLRNLDDFTALIASLDLVISIDNSTVHFSGALGTPTWVLLPCGAEWRWMTSRNDSVWYNAMHLYRNPFPGAGQWSKIIHKVAIDLRHWKERTVSLKTAQAQRLSHDQTDVDSSPRQNGEKSLPAYQSKPHHFDKKAILLNDTTTWYHWGCSCTSIAIHDQLRLRYRETCSVPIYLTAAMAHLPNSLDELDDEKQLHIFSRSQNRLWSLLQSSDIVFINGEGTLHNISTQSLGLLYLAYISKVHLNKQVHIINHSCYPDDTLTVTDNEAYRLYRKVYEQIDHIAVREPVSAHLLAQMGMSVTLSFDCLPLFIDRYYNRTGNLKATVPTIVIAGSVAWGPSQHTAISE